MVTSRSVSGMYFGEHVEKRGFAGAGSAGDQNADSGAHRGRKNLRAFPARCSCSSSSFSAVSGDDSETADGERRTIQSQRRNDGIHARAVRQARIHHGRRFIDAPAYAADDAVDDLQQVPVVAKLDIDLFQDACALDVDQISPVHQDVGDGVVLEKRLERPVPNTSSKQVRLKPFLFGGIQQGLSLSQ